MLPTSAILCVLATSLAGFDEILTLQSGAFRMGRPFHLVDLSTPEKKRAYRTTDFQPIRDVNRH